MRRKPSRHAYVLLGYLPTTRLEHITNKAARRRAVANLFHACMGRITKPLETAGVDGLPMASGDGVTRRTHPILAVYVGDYPEQILASGVKSGECPDCPTAHDELDVPGIRDFRDMDRVLDALELSDDPDPRVFARACADAGIKPIREPFWKCLPWVHIFRSFTPDILHQLYQGGIKHVLNWLKIAFGTAEIDARCRRLPPNHNIRLFMKGISTLSRVSGQEHAHICRILMGLIIDLRLPDGTHPGRLIRAVRGMLDFLYLAQYPLHSSETLELLRDALNRFEENRDIFVELGIREHFNIMKLHFLRHYLDFIMLYGTTDNYNTEYTERLHIELAKDAYRATNHKDEYPQMTLWLERREKIFRHEKYIAWRLAHEPPPLKVVIPSLLPRPRWNIAKHPSCSVSLSQVAEVYGATHFRDAFARYYVHLTQPQLSRAQSECQAANYFIPFQKIPVFHRLKFCNTDERGFTGISEAQVFDSVHAQPQRKDKRGRVIPGRFDTALVRTDPNLPGIRGMYCHYYYSMIA